MMPSRKRKRQKMKKQYEEIFTRITADLEKGIIPWEKPWCLRGEGIVSHSTGHGYSLLNCMLLDRPGKYLTFAQAKREGGMVKKGAKSSAIFFYRQIAIRKDEDGKEPEEPTTRRRSSGRRPGRKRRRTSSSGNDGTASRPEGLTLFHPGRAGRIFFHTSKKIFTISKKGNGTCQTGAATR